MRKSVFTLASAMMLFACQKAVTDSTPATDKPVDKVGTVTLKALLPGFNDETKAGISDVGVFSWVDGENPDVIAVRYTKEGEEDEYVEFTCTDASECEFTGNPTEGFTIATEGSIAFYPADYRGTPSAFSGSAANAPKSFQMKATGFEDGKLAFEHDNALLKVSINNIPSVADNIVVGYGSGYSTVNLSEGGNLSVMVPATASASTNLSIYVKQGNTVLYSKSTSKQVEIKKGYLYTHIPTLSVVASGVYLKSSMTNWAKDEVAPMATDDNVTYTISLQSIGNQFAKVFVKYPGEGAPVWYQMGPETDQSTTESQVLIPADNHSVKLSTLGTYSFTFTPGTGEFSFEKTSDNCTFYVFGSENEWSLTDTSMPLINQTSDGKLYLIGQKGQYKIRYNSFVESSFGYGSSNSGATGVNVFGPSETGSSSVIINIPTDGSGVTYNYFNENYSSTIADSVTEVRIQDYVDGTNTEDLVQDEYNANLWTVTKTFTDNTTYGGTRIKFRFNDNGDWNWDTDSSTSNVEYGSMGQSDGNTFWVQASTYLVVLNYSTGKIKFLRMPSINSGNLPDYSQYDMGAWDDYDI